MRAGSQVTKAPPKRRGALSVIPMPRASTAPTTSFGTYLQSLIDRAGFKTRAELARVSGVDDTTIGRWIRGEKEPTIGGLRAIAPHLRVRLGDLMIRAELATAAELGTVGSPPAPGPTLPAVVRVIMSRLADQRRSAAYKERMLRVVERAIELLDEATEPPREPSLGAGKSRPGRRRT